ncbi:MAG: hypothetical protein JWR22_4135 [Herminiimonas sp.]|nr:hypothetical protein [Herminiimonas sp.]
MSKTPTIISPVHFADSMEEHWTTTLHNVSSDALKTAWLDQGASFGRQILSHENDAASRWEVLQLPTGSGKSQGTAVYCSLLAGYPILHHPGVLIVTRLKADADKMAEDINGLATRDNYAFSYHSDKYADGLLEMLSSFPVLVITHSAYLQALDRISDSCSKRRAWQYFCSWQDSGRRLCVVDEALNIVKEYQVSLDGLRQTMGFIPQFLREKFPREIAAINAALAMLEKQTERGADSGKEAILTDVASIQPCDLSALRSALGTVRFDQMQGRSDNDQNKALYRQHDMRLADLQHILEGWVYHAKIPNQGHTLNTARLVVPEGIKGLTVLDATASANKIYSLFDRAEVLKAPVGIRSYKNVTLHVSKGHNVGKLSLRKNPKDLLDPVMADLNQRLVGRNTLFVSHRDVKPKVLAYKVNFDMKAAHWGAVDGSNAWKDCDSAVIFGLPTNPCTWTANTFFALQGVQDTDWLRSKHRPHKAHEDIRSALQTGQTITKVVQAINRIRCRKVTDVAGNCPNADIYILLPSTDLGDTILKGIVSMMKGISVKHWDIQGTKTSAKRGRKTGSGDVKAGLLAYLKTMMPGSISKTKLMVDVGVSVSSMKRFIVDVKETATDVAKSLVDYGVTFRTEGFGRNARSYFYKQ